MHNIIFTKETVQQFCTLTSDPNPLHVSRTFASLNGFSDCVVNGALTHSFAVSIIVSDLLHQGNIVILESKSSFKRPIYVDQQVTFTVSCISSHLSDSIQIWRVDFKPAISSSQSAQHHVALHSHILTIRLSHEK